MRIAKELKMKNMLSALIVASLTTPVFADDVNGQVEDHYKDVVTRIPHTVQVCDTVEVPVYGSGGFDQGDAIVGGIVGGLLGSQIGKGSGNKVATGVGAMTGAIIGGKQNDKVVGYRQEQRCNNQTTYETERNSVYSHSTITFWENGKRYSLRFQK
jgi:outer membrane lipoprotein SlyB